MSNTYGYSYYVLHVRTRGEENFMREARSICHDKAISLYFPRRSLDIRRKGVIIPSRPAVFPGCVFLELATDEDARRYLWAFRKIKGFYRFLRSNKDITPLQNRDLEVVLHFIKKSGPLAEKSKVYFDENSRIVVMQGPLSGLEGRIVKVDKRKKRAKIRLDLYGDSFSVDLAFEVLVKPGTVIIK